MKARKDSALLRRLIVSLVVLGPQVGLFWLAYSESFNLFVLAALVFFWNFIALFIRFIVVRYVFRLKETIRENILVMFLTSNYLIFSFGIWVFAQKEDVVIAVIPIAALGFYFITWLSQSRYLWEIYTFASFIMALGFGWLLVVMLAFPSIVIAFITLYAGYITAYHWGKIHGLTKTPLILFSGILSLVVSEAVWIMLIWPIRMLPIIAILVGLFYVIGMFWILSHKKKLHKKHVFQYSSTALVFFLALLLTSQWSI